MAKIVLIDKTFVKKTPSTMNSAMNPELNNELNHELQSWSGLVTDNGFV